MIKVSSIAGALALGAATVVLPLAAFAQTSVTTGVDANTTVTTPAVTTSASVKGGAALTNGKARGDKEIDRRITNLNSLSTRLSSMKNVSASDKTSLQANISTEISNLTTLKATVDAETVDANLKTDVQSITKDYRIYMLVIPQGRITAAGDRVATISADFQTLAPKLEARITAAQTAGKNVSAATSAYTDMQAKVSDANTQESAAVSEVASLSPDQGNTTVEASNTASLKDASAKIKVATADLKTARADVTTIVNAVKGTGSASTSASGSATVAQ